jgi:hypothetical protein
MPCPIKPRIRTRKQIVLQLRLEAGQRFCRSGHESRSSTASVPIAAWPALCGHNHAGGLCGLGNDQRRSSDHIPLGRRCRLEERQTVRYVWVHPDDEG